MQVRVNGEAIELPAGCTVAALLERIHLQAARVAVERNQDIVPRAEWAASALNEGDRIEIVSFVGGG
jgi:thiamine biosynthesis protein ThiS